MRRRKQHHFPYAVSLCLTTPESLSFASHIETYLSENASNFYVNQDELRYEWAFCRYFWESHVLLPSIAVETLHLWQQKWQK